MGRRRDKSSANQLRIAAVAEYYTATSKARIEENRKRRNASFLLNKAIREGVLERMPCAVCGGTKTEGHHEDYSAPLEVVWLCRPHHIERHKEIHKNGGGWLARHVEAYVERKRRESGQ